MHIKDVLGAGYRSVFYKKHEPGAEPLFVFMIPLVGPENSQDWGRACAVLEDTLASIQGQGYRHWQVVLCCQERPPNLPDNPRFHFVSAPPYNPASVKSDQNVKGRLMADYAARTFLEFAYVMYLDADDLLHPDLLAHLAADNNGTGYLVEQGYMIDAASGRLAPLGNAPGQKPFSRQCGSCAFIAVDFARQWFPVSYLRLIGKGHKNYVERCNRLGYPLDVIDFPAMLYVVNHGENMQIRRGNGDNKLGYIARNEVTDPEAVAQIYADFQISLQGKAAGGDLPEIDQASMATGFSKLSTMAFSRFAPSAPSITR